jgi:hypothetical protein
VRRNGTAAQLFDLMLDLDQSIELRHREPGAEGQLLGLELVVDERVQVARVVGQRVAVGALIEPQNAGLPQVLGGLKFIGREGSGAGEGLEAAELDQPVSGVTPE